MTTAVDATTSQPPVGRSNSILHTNSTSTGSIEFCVTRRACKVLHHRYCAERAFDNFTTHVPKAPLPKYAEALCAVTEGHGRSFGTVAEQNAWLAEKIHNRLTTTREGPVFAKTLLLLHDLIINGASEFVDALRPYVETQRLFESFAIFDNEQHCNASKKVATQECDPRDSESEHAAAGQFFVNYVHALFEFQVRHRPMGNLLKQSSSDFLATLCRCTKSEGGGGGDDSWTPIFRDVAYSCMTLIKYLIVSQTAIPRHCFVVAEIFRRYVIDCCHLYQLTSRVLQHNMSMARCCKNFSLTEGKKNLACMVQYQRVTTQMDGFFDVLRSLPDDAAVDRSIVPPPLADLPTALTNYCNLKTRMLRSFGTEVEVESLDSLLSRTTESDHLTPHGTAKVLLDGGSVLLEASPHGATPDGQHEEEDASAVLHSRPPTINGSLPRHPAAADGGADDFISEALTADVVRVVPAQHVAIPTDHTGAEASAVYSTLQTFFDEGINVIRTPSDNRQEFSSQRFDCHDDEEEYVNVAPGGGDDDDATVVGQEPGTAKRRVFANSFYREGDNDPQDDDHKDKSGALRFQVLKDQILGKGGFGVVYKAWDEEQGRHVACKEVKLSQDKAGLQELFKEYRVLTTLEHPNIVNVLGFVVKGGHGRIFMEWVPSGSVQAVLQEKNSGLRETIVRRYIREALEGLAYLHSRGIVHRDMKPGNMLLSSEGTVKLTDFGTSRTLEHAAETMQTGTVVGTVPYLAPECVRGTYSAASDVWAVGCAAIHMATGRAPWADEARDNIGLIFKIGNLTEANHLPKAVTEGTDVSEELRSFVEAAVTFDRHERPSAEALLLHPFLAVSEHT